MARPRNFLLRRTMGEGEVVYGLLKGYKYRRILLLLACAASLLLKCWYEEYRG
jgi:hypothetical protein